MTISAAQLKPPSPPEKIKWAATVFLLVLITGTSFVFVGRAGFFKTQSHPAALGEKAATLTVPTLDSFLRMSDADLEAADIIDVNLAVARELPECRNLDAAFYKQKVDEWAARIKQEVERHEYRFSANPAEFKNSHAYFCALVMRTVIDQDFGVRYDLEGFSFEKPGDLFIYGVIDQRKGTCVSLPVLQIAIGQRLGWPIKAVVVPGHTFCRWDDPATGERLNIEAANTAGLVDHDDEYYRHWPYEIDPRWEKDHHVLTSLTRRQHLAVMVGCLGAHFAAKQDAPAAIRWDALAHWLDPADRACFVALRRSIEFSLPKYFDADELAGRKNYWELKPHPSLASNQSFMRHDTQKVDNKSSSGIDKGDMP